MTTALYLRISSEDVDLKTGKKDESESISNQRNLLREYVRSHADLSGSEILEFCDDGWSGKNFERPAVKELLEQVKRGQIHCIVVKDLSRFGRDYLTVGDYISRVFPFLDVRFISVNDGFDSINPQDIDSLDTSFRTLIYDLYSRDLSRKVKSAKNARAERGAFLSPFAPYGYVKDPEDKNHLLVDEDAAAVVRRIFQMAADGIKTWEIAATLNLEGVDTPMLYKRQSGCSRTRWPSVNEENFWTASRIAVVLRDERYIGKVVYGKRNRDIVGSTHTVKMSRSDWIVVSDTHEPIVSDELFAAAQAQMRELREKDSPSSSDRPLKRKVFCGVCGHAMQRNYKKKASYSCRTRKLNTGYGCSDESIPEEDILAAVVDTIQTYAQYAVSIERLLKVRSERRRLDKKQIQRQLQTLQSRKSQLDKRLQDLYEALVEGEISRKGYAAQKQSITTQSEEISRTITELERKSNVDENGGNTVIEQFKSYVGITTLTKEISDAILNRVTIYPDGLMDIKLNLTDEIEALMNELRQETLTA